MHIPSFRAWERLGTLREQGGDSRQPSPKVQASFSLWKPCLRPGFSLLPALTPTWGRLSSELRPFPPSSQSQRGLLGPLCIHQWVGGACLPAATPPPGKSYKGLAAPARSLRRNAAAANLRSLLFSWVNFEGDFAIFFFIPCIFLGKGSPTAAGRTRTLLVARKGFCLFGSDLDVYFALGDLPWGSAVECDCIMTLEELVASDNAVQK